MIGTSREFISNTSLQDLYNQRERLIDYNIKTDLTILCERIGNKYPHSKSENKIKGELLAYLLEKGVNFGDIHSNNIHVLHALINKLITNNSTEESNLVDCFKAILEKFIDYEGQSLDRDRLHNNLLQKYREEYNKIKDFEHFLNDLFASIKNKGSLQTEIKIFFKEKFHNDFDSNSEIVEVIKTSAELAQFKYKNLHLADNKNCSINKIPPILHQVWLVDKEKEIHPDNIVNIKRTHELLEEKSDYTWQHIVWTNNKQLFPKSVKELENIGVVIKELHDYNLSKYNLIEDNLRHADIGKAVDITKLAVVETFGGVYTDLDYGLFKELDTEICNFNFVSNLLDSFTATENYFFIASKEHPILKCALNDIERNLSPNTVPLWNQYYYDNNITHSDTSTDTFTYRPLEKAIYKAGHKDGNVDVLYPPPVAKVKSEQLLPAEILQFNTVLDYVLTIFQTKYIPNSDFIYKFIESSIKDEDFQEADYSVGMRFLQLHTTCSIVADEQHIIGENSYNGIHGSWTTNLEEI